MKFYGDYHTHSQNSDGRQSIGDIILSARDRGLQEVAVTDHGPLVAVIGVKQADCYLDMREEIDLYNDELNAEKCDIRVLLGAEANIRDLNGKLDIPAHIIDQLDLLIAGLHPYTLPPSIDEGLKLMVQNSLRHLGQAQREKAVNANTKATIEALYQNPQVDILAHPGLFFRVDIEEVARACIKNEVMFEINCGHSHPDISDIIKAYEAGVDFIVNSDAHFRETVGNLDYGRHVIESLGIEPERVVNCQPEGGGRDGSRQTYGFACFNNYRPVRSRENPGDKLP